MRDSHEWTARRHSLGMTQEALAARLGVNRVTLARWEAGTRRAPAGLLRLALARLEWEATRLPVRR